MGGPACSFKKFADASSKSRFNSAWPDKVAAARTNSTPTNGDGSSTGSDFFTRLPHRGQVLIGTGRRRQTRKKTVQLTAAGRPARAARWWDRCPVPSSTRGRGWVACKKPGGPVSADYVTQ